MLWPSPLPLPVTNQTLDMKSPLRYGRPEDQTNGSEARAAVLLAPCAFKSDVRRTPPHEATQIPGRSSPTGRSPVGRRQFVCHSDPRDVIRPSPKDDPSDAPTNVASSASVPTPRG